MREAKPLWTWKGPARATAQQVRREACVKGRPIPKPRGREGPPQSNKPLSPSPHLQASLHHGQGQHQGGQQEVGAPGPIEREEGRGR